MRKPVQKRTLKTRARLISVAERLVQDNGYEALRVEEVVRGAGVAKGTFFAHFRDKDALMEHLIGTRLLDLLETAGSGAPPKSAAELVAALDPVHAFMTSERYVFDIVIRYSGAAAVAEIGPVAQSFERYLRLVAGWLPGSAFRRDVEPDLLAEGVQAFAVQAMALKFCALHRETDPRDRLLRYLDAWLTPAA